MIWALIPSPIKRAVAWLLAGLAAVWAIRAGAKREARQQTALDAAEAYAKTRKDIDHANDGIDSDAGTLREWLRERDPNVK